MTLYTRIVQFFGTQYQQGNLWKYILGVCIGILVVRYVPEAYAQGAIKLPKVELDSIREGDAVQMFNLTAQKLLLGIRYAFEGVAIFFIVFYGTMMVVSFGNEDEIKNNQMGLVYAVLGFLLINYSGLVIEVVNPRTAGEVVNQQALERLIYDRVITFIRFAIGSIAMAIIVFKGFKLVTAAGNADEIKKDKTYILWACIGLIIITVARPIQMVFTTGAEGLNVGAELMSRFTNLLLYIVPPLGIFFIIYGAVFMLFSNGDEERYKKGISIIKGTVIALVIIYSAYPVIGEILKFTQNL